MRWFAGDRRDVSVWLGLLGCQRDLDVRIQAGDVLMSHDTLEVVWRGGERPVPRDLVIRAKSG